MSANIIEVLALRCNSSSGADEPFVVTEADTKEAEEEQQLDFRQIAMAIKMSPVRKKADEYTDLIMEQLHLFVKPKTFSLIDGTFCFYRGGTHMIIAESKEGKTTFVVAELLKSKMNVIILDGDGNSTTATEKAGKNTKWLQPTDPDGLVDYYIAVIEKGIDFSNHVFVIDSLQNFTDGRDLDSNNGMKGIILRLKKLTHTGATLVILHHVTATGDKNKPLKPKGNAEVLYSSCDVTYGFYRHNGLTAIKSRIEGIENGQQLGYGKNQSSSESPVSLDEMLEVK